MMLLSHDDRLTWARTIAGEARGESRRGQLAVAFVPFNRARLSGRSVAQECTRKWQFSCWNTDDPNRATILALQEHALVPFFSHILAILSGKADPSHRATFYHVLSIQPRWSIGHEPCAIIGGHRFYRNIAPYLEPA